MKDLVRKLRTSKKSQYIIREKVWIDTKIVNSSYKHLNNKVTHCVFKSDADPSVVPKGLAKDNKMITDVCFAGLLSKISSSRANRMYFKLEVAKPKVLGATNEPVLTPKQRSGWLSLAKKYKLLPPYINENAIEDIPKEDQKLVKVSGVSNNTAIAFGEFIIDLEGLSPIMLYIYLSTIRNIREDPGLPRAVLYLVNKIGMNFFAAYVFSSMVTLNSTGHHILDVYRPYGMCKEVYNKASGAYTSESLDLKFIESSVVVPISKAIGLQRIVNNSPFKYDDRKLLSKDNYKYGFNCSSTINKVSEAQYSATFQELFDEDIIDTIMSKDDKEANECLKRFTEKKPHIKYKEAEK